MVAVLKLPMYRVAKLAVTLEMERENEEVKRKWRKNEEMKRE